jgi:hypothetical protein
MQSSAVQCSLNNYTHIEAIKWLGHIMRLRLKWSFSHAVATANERSNIVTTYGSHCATINND